MLTLKGCNEKTALLLNHRQLINELYKTDLLEPKIEIYELKSELFYYESKCKQSRKRKWDQKSNELHGGEATESNPITSILNNYLEQLPLPEEQSKVVKTSLIDRCWEDAYSLPQLHGENISGKFQKFQLNGEGATYIIPHGALFYNHNVDLLSSLIPQLMPAYDIIIVDPPWRNKYIRRLKRAKQSLGYSMMYNDQLAMLPVAQLTHNHSIIAIWCTNSAQHQNALESQLLPQWQLRLLHKLRWYKLNSEHKLVGTLTEESTLKQPYELLYLACHIDSPVGYAEGAKQVESLLSIPSIVHSHKPPLISWLRQHLIIQQPTETQPRCLELFARYLQPNCTSIGLEVLKLMDERLYNKVGTG